MKNDNFGFTLIELLVAITIGIVMVGLGSVALNSFNDQQKVDTTKQELLANLRLARNYAITNQLPSGGNRVQVTIDGSGVMTIQSRDAGNTGAVILFSKDITPDGVTATISPTTIRFSVSDGRSFNLSGTTLIGTTATALVVGDVGTSKLIKIDESGLIYEE
ncbi:MAG: prepilin-type N-terminal cleavage/methylation domain-containing protein [Candidatus Shapirobacteria bacterium]|nr:prepilin-type N-terminal cleavage/methylation domain-containing protein [Candidatus Shapirobacteria bacterium]